MSPQPVSPPSPRPPRRLPPGLLLRGNLYSLRLKVPKALQARVGRTHVCRALGTGRLNEAVRRARVVAGEIEAGWAAAEDRPAAAVVTARPVQPVATPAPPAPQPARVPTLQAALEGYLADPGRRRHAKATSVYRHILGVAGPLLSPDTPDATPLAALTRADGRRLIDGLRALPANYQRRFPSLSQGAVLTLAASRPRLRRISDVTINGYLVRLTAVLSWAAREGWIDRNPWAGLKIALATTRARRREPFSIAQLNTLLAAPLYAGCVDDGQGFARPGLARPRRGRLLNNKCWFCETPITRSDNAVDHFRPKGRVSDASRPHAGYRWLAFELRNFRYACTFCNSRRVDVENETAGGKADRFPLLNEAARVYKVEVDDLDFDDLLRSVRDERCEILDPCNITDWKLLGCMQENGKPCPASGDAISIRRVNTSIEVYHLDHEPTCKQRHLVAGTLLEAVRDAKSLFLKVDEDIPSTEQDFVAVAARIQRMIDRDAPYSGEMMFLLRGQRSSKHPWIDDLLEA